MGKRVALSSELFNLREFMTIIVKSMLGDKLQMNVLWVDCSLKDQIKKYRKFGRTCIEGRVYISYSLFKFVEFMT